VQGIRRQTDERGRERLVYPIWLLGWALLAARPGTRFDHHEPFTAEADLVQQSSHIVDP
jgi:hypothetical protein